jgi:hypothetical protein
MVDVVVTTLFMQMLAPHFGGMTSWSTLFISSMLAGVNAALASLPFDMIKTRLQRMQPLPDGTMPYSGIADCARKIIQKEGVAALYTVCTHLCRSIHTRHLTG